jgi:hypothetical protein
MKRGPVGCWRSLRSQLSRRHSRRLRKRPTLSALFAAEVEQLEARAMLSAVHASAAPATPGTWTPLTNLAPTPGTGTMMLLSDGRVMVQGGGVSSAWSALTPDGAGNYINGTWSTLSPMSLERLYVGSNVLPSGNVFVVGGEYSGPSGVQNLTNTGEIYDPINDVWTTIPNFPQSKFGDDPTVVLASGKILAGYVNGPQTYLFDPSNNSWTPTGTKLRGDASDEETWVLLNDGSVLSYDVFSSISTGVGHAQRYVPSSGTWVDAGVVPVPLSNPSVGFELGPAALLPDGRVFQVGANGNTAIYTPSTNSWVAGPTLPTGTGADDAPGAMLPNGHFIFAADNPLFNAPTILLDYDPVANTISDVTPTGALGTALGVQPSFVDRMLVLPNGDLLLTTSDSQLWEYTPTGSPNSAWAPNITNITPSGFNTFTVTGTQLTGLSAGSSYGDDAESDTNYPIIRLTNTSGVVKYARSFNWTPSVATGNTQQTVQFTLPQGFPPGGYHVSVIANGIASSDFALGLLGPQSVSVTPVPPTQALVSWSPIAAADGYRIFLYNNVTHKNGQLLASVGAGTTSKTVSGLAPGTQQYIVVEAFSATIAPFVADSQPVSVSMPLPAPVLSVTYPSNNTLAVLHWNAITPVQGYRLYTFVGSTKVLLGVLKPNATSVTLIGLKHGTPVQFMLEAFNGNVVADSTVITVTT